jgi:hypothetical protein
MDNKQNRARLIVGAVLVLLGIFFLFGELVEQVFNFRIGQYTWPLTILIPGVLLYLTAFVTDQKTSRGLLAAGSLISAVGFLLFVQNLTGWWATWAYAWALIFPTSIGLGKMLFGLLRQHEDLLSEGWRLTKIGATILFFGVVFFELLIGVSGFRFFGLRGFCFPVALVILGLVILLRSLLPGRRPVESIPAAPLPTTPPASSSSESISEAAPLAASTPEAGPVEWVSGEDPAQNEEK